MGFHCDQLLVLMLCVFCITPSLNSFMCAATKKPPNKAKHKSETTVIHFKENMVKGMSIKTNNY